ncbi:HNH endonuclease family protein, partial [Loigolactobacillus coryniformis]
MAFFLSGGVFPEGKTHCLHHCDNPPCCNPEHLFAGSNLDNIYD